MNNENVNRVIKLQTAVNNQIYNKGKADTELVKDLENLFNSLNSYECELVMEWYNKQSKKEDEQYVQMEIDFLAEQQGQTDLLNQWDI